MRIDPVTVVVAEDHAVVREGTRQMLENDDLISVIGEAVDGPAAVAACSKLSPDVLLLDMSLPAMNGIEVTHRVLAQPHPPRVLILSAYDDTDYVTAALDAGAGGYLLKTAGSQEVIAAIVAVSRGDIVLHPTVAKRALERGAQGESTSALSEREVEVLRLAAKGSRTKEIAAQLSVSTRTVESHFTSIYNKLGVSSRTEAVLYAAAHGWVNHDTESSGEF
jgi:DNA-binding NarL/FixJ family response regulator